MPNVFQEQLNSWRSSASRISSEAAESGTSFFQKINPFKSRLSLPVSDRPSTEPAEEPSWFTLSRWDRLIVFGVCLALSVLLFTSCFTLLPVLTLKPRKFATIWTLASLLFVISFGVLQGPVNYISHLFSPGRIWFTLAYFGSILATLGFSIGAKSTILTLLAVIVQIIAAIWYTVSYFPMGVQSLKFASRVGYSQVSGWLNV